MTNVTYGIAPQAATYYDRTSRDLAVQIISEMVEEWDYAKDAHGYCHVRPALLRLLEVAQEAGYQPKLLSADA